MDIFQNRLLIFSSALAVFMFLAFFANSVHAAIVIIPGDDIEADLPRCPSLEGALIPPCFSDPPQGDICYNGPNTSDPGTCTEKKACLLGTPWSEYHAVCSLLTENFRCIWTYEYVRGFSTADKCIVPETGLRAGLCSPGGVGGTYKTCCANAAPAQCATVAPFQDAYNPAEGSCPAGTTEKLCGFDNYPACGAAACASPTLSVRASAIPSFGTAPLLDVDIKADVIGGTATGDITYSFKCMSSNSWQRGTPGPATSLTATDFCDYPTPGTYTAAVKAERQGVSAEDTVDVTVGTRNLAPTVSCSASPTSVYTGDPISVTVTGRDTDSGIAALKLSSGQGNTIGAFSCNGQNSCSHVFSTSHSTAGTYRYTGVATDMEGKSAENLCNSVVVRDRGPDDVDEPPPGTDEITCTASGGWSGSKNPAGGTQNVQVFGGAGACTQYQLDCTDPATGAIAQDSVSVCILPRTCTTTDTRLFCPLGGDLTRHTEICSDGNVTVTQTGSCTSTESGDDDNNGGAGLGSGNAPQALNLSSTQGNYCFVSSPPVILSWQFSDQDAGDRQTSYQVQVDTSSSFASPDRDSGKVSSSNPQYAPGQLNYETTYYWRVRVWDASNQQSNWSSAPVFATASHAFPNTDFSWLPVAPATAELVQFSDETVFSQGSQSKSWSWAFGDGTTSPGQNPSHAYAAEQEYEVSLQACDDAGCCARQDIVNIAIPFPDIKEISPFNFFQEIFRTFAFLAP